VAAGGRLQRGSGTRSPCWHLAEALGTLAVLGACGLWCMVVGASLMQCHLWLPTAVLDACLSAFDGLWPMGP
jgi:hypothetical protein